jgi:hypothetical protein
MSNKYLIPLIVAISILFTGAVALVQSRNSNNKVAIVSSSSVVGGSSAISSNSQVVFSSSNSNMESSSGKIQESTQSQTLSVQSYAPSSINQLQVEVLDSNNPPKYITDYLTCQKTSPTKEFGILIESEDGKLEYKCPKSLEYYGCEDLGENPNPPRNKLIWRGEVSTEKNLKDEFSNWATSKKISPETINTVLNSMHFKEGWSCNTLFGGGREQFGCGANYGFPVEELKLEYIFSYERNKLISTLGSCVVILNQNIPQKDIQLLKNYKSISAGKLKFVTIKN